MSDRPILFSGPMVRAILAGAKTQTRRICQGARELSCAKDWPLDTCPYGRVGGRLWVRETFRQGDGSMSVHYRADEDEVSGGPWRPSIFMPRWASRITLEVTEVRVERLQEISEEDARAEGAEAICAQCGQTPEQDDETEAHWICEDGNDGVPFGHRVGFERLWNEINGDRAPWSSNPWVWAITFRRAGAEASR